MLKYTMLRRVKDALGSGENDDNNGATAAIEDGNEPQRQQKLAMVVDVAESTSWAGSLVPIVDQARFPYSRPEFLYFTDDEIALSADQRTRPIVVAKQPTKMPLYAGYAECINAGKTTRNEDQACARRLPLVQTGWTTVDETPQGSQETPSDNRRRNSNRQAPPPASSVFRDGTRRSTSECRHGDGGDSRRSRRYSDDELLSDLAGNSSTPFGREGNGQMAPRSDAFYFAVFDGHAGSGAAVMAANCLHEHIRERLNQVLQTILHLDRQEQLVGYTGRNGVLVSTSGGKQHQEAVVCSPNGKPLTRDGLVVGALETAFVEMDEQIMEDKLLWRIPGGCASLCVLFLLDKVYVANAGDCRAVLSLTRGADEKNVQQLSCDFTPENERKRLQYLAYRSQDLIGTAFTRLEYSRFLSRRDLKKKVLYRDWYMDGWAAKTVRDTDLRPTLISDGPRKVAHTARLTVFWPHPHYVDKQLRRLLNTIGVSRGFGDHHLLTVDDKIPLKPFLTPVPEVQVFNLTTMDTLTDRDVLIMASDGLWDVLTNEQAHTIVQSALTSTDVDERAKYTMAAQDLVIAARGNPTMNGRWQLLNTVASGTGLASASTDDICCFVIPLKYALGPTACEDDDDIELLQ